MVAANNWAIEKVVFGDGSTGNCGRILRTCTYYASSCARGGTEQYHEIAISTLRLSTRGRSNIRFGFKAISADAKKRPLPERGPRVTITKRHNTQVRRGVKEFMEQNPGVEVWVHGPGARSANRDLKTSLAS